MKKDNKEFEQKLKEYELTTDYSQKSKLALNISDTLWETNQLEKSREYSTAGIEYAQMCGDRFLEAGNWQSMAVSYSIQGDNLKALDLLQQALILYVEAGGDPYSTYGCLSNMGAIECCLGKYEQALTHMFEAARVAQSLEKTVNLAKVFSNIAIVYRRLDNLDKALEYNKKALKIRQIDISDGEIATSYNNIGTLFYLKKRFPSALNNYKKAMHIWKKENNYGRLAMVYSNIGQLYADTGQMETALDFYQKSVTMAKETKAKVTIILGLKDLAGLYTRLERIDEAKVYWNMAIAEAENFHDLDTLLSLTYDYALFNKKIGNFEVSTEYLLKHSELYRKNFNDQLSNQIAELESKYEIEQEKKETEIYRLKNVELVKSHAEIEKHRTELFELNKSKDTILHIVSHDLRNAIGGIHSVVDLIMLEDLTENLKRYVEIINYSSEKAITLVNDLLESHRINLDSFNLNLDRLNIIEVFLEYETIFKVMATQKNIKIKFNYQIAECYVKLNMDKFWQIMSNIISNSIKFSHRDSEIELTVFCTNYKGKSYCCIIVKDFGIGIKSEDLPLIFDKFTKIRKRGTEGEETTGLGMSIVKRLVELHDGIIEVNSHEEAGTEFKMYFPIG